MLELAAASAITPYWHFSGVLHPAMAHFPVALLTVAALIEVPGLFRRGHKPGSAAYTCLLVGALGAVAAAALGWANADAAHEFNGKLRGIVAVHRWLGVSVAGLAVVTALLATIARQRQRGVTVMRLYRGGVFAGAALVGLVGSYGGKLTHGVDYYSEAYAKLTEELKVLHSPSLAGGGDLARAATVAATTAPTTPPPASAGEDPRPVVATNDPAPADAGPVPSAGDSQPVGMPAPSEAVSFTGQIKPILEANCTKCHNEVKKKGGYRLDSKKAAFLGGESGEAPIVPGNSEASPLVQIVEGKGKYADGRMPPKGTLLTGEQIAVIRKWSDEGADWPEQ